MSLRYLLLALTLMVTACAAGPSYETSVILLRHGESEANARHIIASNPLGLGRTVGLTQKGRDQIHEAAIKIQGLIETRPHRGFVIIASPFKRTVETADVLIDTLGMPGQYRVEPRFQERFFGVFEGLDSDHYEKVWARDRAGEMPDPDWNVEGLESVHKRTQTALERLRKTYPGHAIIIVTHGDVASVMIATDRDEPLRQHRDIGALPPAGIAVLRH